MRERYADIAIALGVAPRESPPATAEAGLARLVDLSRSCGVPQRLRDVNIPEADLPRLAREAFKIQRLLKNNPREVTEADALAIYRAAYVEMVRGWTRPQAVANARPTSPPTFNALIRQQTDPRRHARRSGGHRAGVDHEGIRRSPRCGPSAGPW